MANAAAAFGKDKNALGQVLDKMFPLAAEQEREGPVEDGGFVKNWWPEGGMGGASVDNGS